MDKQEARNVMLSSVLGALTLGVMGSFFMRDNIFQATAILIVAFVFMTFYAMKYMRVKAKIESKYDDKESVSDYYKRISKHRRK